MTKQENIRFIPYSRQCVSDKDIQAVVEVLKSDFLTTGPKTPEFEQALATYCGAKFAIAANSATTALHAACQALGVGSGDRVWTSPNSFVASANCALYCKAKVDFVDIDPNTMNMDTVALEKKLSLAKAANLLPKVVIPVHFAGRTCDMEKICALSKIYGFKLIEDASQALGGSYQDQRKVGSCSHSDITVLSFHAVKSITSCEGGMLLTNDPAINKLARLFVHQGITRDRGQFTQADEGPWYYEQLVLGSNYRLSDVQASLGISQLANLDSFIAARTRLAKRYTSLLDGLPITTPQHSKGDASAWHLYVIHLTNLDKSRADIFAYMAQQKIGLNVHYIPIHLQPYYRDLGFKRGDFPNGEHHYQTAISIPLYPTLTDSEQDYVVECLKQALAL